LDDTTTFGEFLRSQSFGEYFVNHYAVPLVSCVWSSGDHDAADFPAAYLFRFLDQHGMLRIRPALQWLTIAGGSRTYVERLAAKLPVIRVARPVTSVRRYDDGVEVRDATGEITLVDKVVIATHADEALSILANPTPEEKRVLGAFTYSTNTTVLHSTDGFLPAAPHARASWNYRKRSCDASGEPPTVTYWMNLLHRYREPRNYLVTLNGERLADYPDVFASMEYRHPIYTSEMVAAQRQLPSLATSRIAFAGAYFGWGFHEDGCRSGVEAARAFGVSW
jgi:predicted NAD/FAD-binding protein